MIKKKFPYPRNDNHISKWRRKLEIISLKQISNYYKEN